MSLVSIQQQQQASAVMGPDDGLGLPQELEDGEVVGDEEFSLNFSRRHTEWPHEWTRRPDCDEFVGSKRSKHTLVGFRGALYAFGGDNGQRMLNDLLRYNVTDSSWCRACTMGNNPAPRYHHSSVVSGTSMFIFGGYTGDIHSNYNLMNRNDLYEYNFLNCTWIEWKFAPGSPRPVARSAHGAAVYDGKLWIYAGYDGNNRLNDMWTISLKDSQSGRWEEVDQAGDRPPTCCNFALTVARDCMFVFSGQSGARVTNDLFRFNFNDRTWSRISTIDHILRGVGTGPIRRYGHTMVHHGRCLYVFGGAADSTLPNDLYSYDLDAGSWQVIQPASGSDVPSERLFHAAAVVDDAMYIYGGTIDNKDRSNQVYRFQLSSHPPCTLRDDLRKLLLNQQFVDLYFHVRGGNPGNHQNSIQTVSFPAHRAVAGARSAYFLRRIIELLNDENDSSDPPPPQIGSSTSPQPIHIHLPNVDHEPFELVLGWMYTDEIDDKKVSTDPLSNKMVLIMMDVYNLSVRFQMRKLEALCEQYLNAAITHQNVLVALKNATEMELHFIKEVCMKFILREVNYNAVIMSDHFESLPQPLMVEIIRRKQIPAFPPHLAPGQASGRARDRSGWATGDGSLERDLELFLADEEAASKLSDITLLLASEVRNSVPETGNENSPHPPPPARDSIQAHRSLLAARSSYFEAMFRSFAPRDNLVRVAINQLIPSVSSFNSLLRYIYAGQAEMACEDSLYLYHASSFYGFTNSRFQSMCKWNLERNVHMGNVVKVLEAADEIRVPAMRSHALAIIVENFVEVSQMDSFRNLSRHLLLDIIDSLAAKIVYLPPDDRRGPASSSETSHPLATMTRDHPN